jgi:hypothetical protein
MMRKVGRQCDQIAQIFAWWEIDNWDIFLKNTDTARLFGGYFFFAKSYE